MHSLPRFAVDKNDSSYIHLDACVSISNNGEDGPNCLRASSQTPCKTVTYAIQGGFKIICVNGIFYNISENIQINNKTETGKHRGVTVLCLSCMIHNSIVNLDSTYHVAGQITFVNFTIKNSYIQLGNIYVRFKDVIFEQVMIRDLEHVPNQVHFIRSSLSCSDTKACGVSFFNSSIVTCIIEYSKLELFKLNLNIGALILSIFDSTLIKSDISANAISPPYLRVPSFIEFHSVTVNENGTNSSPSNRHKRRTEYSEIILVLTNPYIVINGCQFHYVHMTIATNIQEFRQAYFWCVITDTKFVDSYYEGNGGVLTVNSEAEYSKLLICSSNFSNNTAVKGIGAVKGSGGAVFIKSDLLEVEFENCLFENNRADDIGLDLYLSTGVTVSFTNCSFHFSVDPGYPTQNVMVFIAGISTQFNGELKIEHARPESYKGKINLLYVDTGKDFHIKITCPLWYSHSVQYSSLSTGSGILKDLEYDCKPCFDNYYTTSAQHNDFSYGGNVDIRALGFPDQDKTGDICIKCPYGGICTGNNVKPRPNYWGHSYEGEIHFIQCPAGYCCSSSESSTCNMYDYCAGNKTGLLCGACKEGFSVSILTGICTPDSHCGGNWWFWLFAFLSEMAYALWYTFKDDIFALYIAIFTYAEHWYKRPNSKINVAQLNTSQSKSSLSCFSSLKNDTKCREHHKSYQKEDVDKGYFGIVTYYVQMTAVIKIQIEFSDIDKSDSFMDKIINNIGRFMNIELTQMSFDICPVVGLTTLGRHIYSFSFLLGIYHTQLFPPYLDLS